MAAIQDDIVMLLVFVMAEIEDDVTNLSGLSWQQ